MVMPGLPLPAFLLGVAGVIVFSFVATEWLGPRARRGRRLNLIRNRRVYRVFRNRWLQAVPQLAMLAVLGGLVYAGLFGSRVANVTPVAVWTLWWGGLIFAVLLFGSAWCFACPWDGLANLMSRLRAAARVEPISFALAFPRWLESVYPALALFVVLTWLELGYGVTTDPRATAYLGLGMAALAVAGALLWDGKRFCAHLCPVGRICGIYSNFSPIEIRARNPRTCQRCTTEDCLHGNDRGYPCPTGLSLKSVADASDCTLCTECIKSCDKHNVALNLRPFGADLQRPEPASMDRAWLALALLSLTLFHGLSMTSAWESFEPGRTSILKWLGLQLGTGHVVSFSLAMAVAVAIPIGLYWACCRVSSWWAADGVASGTLFASYAWSLLPVALFYHLAHNLMHLLMEGGAVVPLLSDPLGRDWDLFGTRSLSLGPPVSEATLWTLQVVLILIGHVVGIIVAHRIGHRIHADRGAARRSLIPIPAMMVVVSTGALWLMHLDMNMRVGRM
jgi:ferredoxin